MLVDHGLIYIRFRPVPLAVVRLRVARDRPFRAAASTLAVPG